MEALEATEGVPAAVEAAVAADEDLFGSEVDEDKDPTYVPPEKPPKPVFDTRSKSNPVAGTSGTRSTPVAGTLGTVKTVGRVKPLFTSPIKPLPGAAG